MKHSNLKRKFKHRNKIFGTFKFYFKVNTQEQNKKKKLKQTLM